MNEQIMFQNRRALMFNFILIQLLLMVYLTSDSLAIRVMRGYTLPAALILTAAVVITILSIWNLVEIIKVGNSEARAKEWFQRIFDASPSLISIEQIDDGTYVDVNNTWQQFMGFSREEVLGEERQAFAEQEAVGIMQQETIARPGIRNERVYYRTRGGETRTGLLSTELVDVEDIKFLIAMINDTTELDHLQTELARLDRLNLVGQMAAGISHEIRNPITTVRGFLQLLQKKEKSHFEEYGLMIRELDRVNDIVSEYLSLARDRLTKPTRQNLNDVISEIIPLINADAIKMGHKLSCEFGDVPDTVFDGNEIRQLIFNLVRNGLESMQYAGILTIRTYAAKGFVFLQVEDQGTGMDPFVKEKIGTPFFTTKEEGTGLGLAVCYSIATRHSAKLSFESGPEGTVFTVRFRMQPAEGKEEEKKEDSIQA